MKQIIIIVVAALLFLVIGIGIYFAFHNSNDSRTTNNEAEKDTKGRYLTIINDTNQVINEVHITVGEGKEFEHENQENPDKKSFPIKIPDSYDKYEEFTVTLIDRYGIKYQRTVTVQKVSDTVPKVMIDVKITGEDYLKQKGDFKRKLDRFFNND